MPHTILGSYAGEWFEVTTPEQAALLSDPQAVRHLEPFLGRTLGTAQAAREVGVSTEGMMYRVRQFQRLGLLTQVGEQRRSGRPVRLYRAPGALRIPFHLTPFEDLQRQLRVQVRNLETLRIRASARLLERAEGRGRLLYRSEGTGSVNSEAEVPDPRLRERQVGGEFTGTLWLTAVQARAVQVQIDALMVLLDPAQQPQEGTRPYLLAGLLLPLDPEQDAPWLSAPG